MASDRLLPLADMEQMMGADMDRELEALYRDGFTERMAREWLAAQRDEAASGLYDPADLERLHRMGFLAGSACCYDPELLDKGAYLTDYDFYRLWPLNAWQRIWINDKLTLFYMLNGTPYAKYLPEYFFYSTGEGALCAIPPHDSDLGLEQVLRARGDIACKPCNGSLSKGFFRLSFADGAFKINGEPASPEDIDRFPAGHPNYVFTEYLQPITSMGKIDPLIHTLRVLVVNQHGNDPFIAANYLRFGMQEVAQKTGAANYTCLTTPEDRDYVAHVDEATGRYGEGKLAYATKLEDAPAHPDSKVAVEGDLPFWGEVVELSLGIARYMPVLSYLGFDIGITEDGPKLMEINSHSGVHYLQMFTPLMADGWFRSFAEERICALEAMDDAARDRHWRIAR